jgi:hypothetical protein
LKDFGQDSSQRNLALLPLALPTGALSFGRRFRPAGLVQRASYCRAIDVYLINHRLGTRQIRGGIVSVLGRNS